MRLINNVIQNGFHRRGLRGGLLSIYIHHYDGYAESTGRYHRHPWRWALSIQLRGVMEDVPHGGATDLRRGFSVRVYGKAHRHWVARADGWSLFIGICRNGHPTSNADCRTEDRLWAHYTELTASEGGNWEGMVKCLR